MRPDGPVSDGSVVAGEATRASDAARFDADEPELGILKANLHEHGQRPLRR